MIIVPAVYVFNQAGLCAAFMVNLATTIPDEEGNLRLVAPMPIPGNPEQVIDRVPADSCYEPDQALVTTVNHLGEQMLELHGEIIKVLEDHGKPITDQSGDSTGSQVWH